MQSWTHENKKTNSAPILSALKSLNFTQAQTSAVNKNRKFETTLITR